MERKKVSRAEISKFLNSENDEHRYAAKNWLVTQVLEHQKFTYQDFCFDENQNFADNKIHIYKEVLIDRLKDNIYTRNGNEEAFFAFLQTFPDYTELLLNLGKRAKQKFFSEILQKLTSVSVNENEIMELFKLFAQKQEENINFITLEHQHLLLEIFYNFVKSGKKISQKELLGSKINLAFSLDSQICFEIEKLAVENWIFPDVEGAGEGDLKTFILLCNANKLQETLYATLEKVINPYNATLICDFVPNFLMTDASHGEQIISLLKTGINDYKGNAAELIKALLPYKGQKNISPVISALCQKAIVTSHLFLIVAVNWENKLKHFKLEEIMPNGHKKGALLLHKLGYPSFPPELKNGWKDILKKYDLEDDLQKIAQEQKENQKLLELFLNNQIDCD